MTQTTIWHDIAEPFVSIKEGQDRRQVIILDTSVPETTLTFSLDGVGAALECAMIMLADEASMPLKIRVIHNAPDTHARVMVRSVARNHSRVAVEAVLQCPKGADNSTTYFSHHALHLTGDAQTRAIPSLEIEADGISATHAVSVGYVDSQALWYGQTRGIVKETLLNEMARGFAMQDIRSQVWSDSAPAVLKDVDMFMAHT